ncbi:MAG TPA: TIGR02530 family flagellar biosynthesis protein [Lachnospiraceae bacterium]|nr:TIGR02530 family flagellar biosynthesis protein [Lachnospiraceae bacterium]
MKIQNNQFLSIEQLQDQYLNQSKISKSNTINKGLSFQEILDQRTTNKEVIDNRTLKFSKHAINRLEDRNILLTDNQLERLSDGTRKASEKGINESLVLVDQLAFIVNIPNKTVVTAMDQTETKENIFTNIDGAVIV